MKIDSTVIGAFITGVFALAAAYVASSPRGIHMEGNRYINIAPNTHQASTYSHGGNATSIRNINTVISDNRVAAGDGAIVIQNSNNNVNSKVIINGKVVE